MKWLLLAALLTNAEAAQSITYQVDVVVFQEAAKAADPERVKSIIGTGSFDSREECLDAALSAIQQFISELRRQDLVIGAAFKCTEHI